MPSSGSTTGAPIAISGGGVGAGTGLDPYLAPIRTLMPISRYAKIMGINLAHFWQMDGAKAPTTGGCDDIWDEESRLTLSEHIAQAEELIARAWGTWPAPKFITNERIPFGLNLNTRGDWQNAEVKTRWREVECFGTEQLTLVKADALIEYVTYDNNPFGALEVARIGGNLYEDLTACAEECQVAIFFREEDGAKDSADNRWEIRPIKVDIDGTTMRITADSAMFIKPTLRNLTEADCLGSDDPEQWIYDYDVTNLVSYVDVYCRTVNTQSPVTLLWDGVCNCTGECSHKTQTACAYKTDSRLGSFAPRSSTWNGTANIYSAPTYSFPPESLIVDYRAGWPLDDYCQMNRLLERAIVKLTNSLLPAPPCGFCDPANIRWSNDRTNVNPLTPESAALPWDIYTQGALEAWRIVKRMAYGNGGML